MNTRIQKFYKLWLEIVPFRYLYKKQIQHWDLEICEYEGPGIYKNRKTFGSLNPGDRWGKTGDTGIFRRELQATDVSQGYPLYLELITGGEALISINGHPYQGNDPNHYRILLTPQSNGNETYHVEVESFVRLSHNEIGETRYDAACTGEFLQADLCSVKWEAQEFIWDIQFALELWQTNPEYEHPIIQTLTHIFTSFDISNQESFLEYVKEGREYIHSQLDHLGVQQNEFTLWMIGQSHLDLAWFWRKHESYRKVIRTFTSVLRNMEQYDFYRFMMPQVNLFKMLQEGSPETFAQVRERVREGRIEIGGLMYVEPDTNLVSGEWLVRQILLGRKFSQQEFGIVPRVESLIDAFGYSGNLPQILKKSEIDAVMVTKMRWYNDTNSFPYSAFLWKGIDGTDLLSATMPGFNYQCNCQSAKYALDENLQKEVVKDIPVFFGWGDGGGGSDENHLQGLQRLMSWYKPALVKTSGFHEYFLQLEKTREKLPTWWGEIYQEGHRGCYTSQAMSKKYNRQSESLYRSLEFLTGFATLLGEDNGYEQLKENIELILINQFHDILPGSAVHQVYLDSYRDYEKVLTEGEQFLSRCLAKIHKRINTEGEGIPIIVWHFNQATLPTQVHVPWDGEDAGLLVNADGESIPYMIKDHQLDFIARSLPPLGYEVFRYMEAPGIDSEQAKFTSCNMLENDRYQVTLNAQGQITSIIDKGYQRELLVENSIGNCLKVYFDYPKSNDAWDIDADCKNAYQLLNGELTQSVQSDRLKQWATVKYTFGSSEIEQDVILWHDSNRLDFETRVQWHEKHRLLKSEFVFDIHASKAVYDIPFGVIERDTHPNNSFQKAQFEVPGLSFVDLSEGNYGVSMISEFKNGFSAKDQSVSISLLRSPAFPDMEADQGEHAFHYCLVGHCGDFRKGHVVHESRNMVNSTFAMKELRHPGSLPQKLSFISVDRENVIVEALKAAEDGNGLILRVYETYGQQEMCKVSINAGINHIDECNLVEEKIPGWFEFEGHQLIFRIHPFEIKTFRLRQLE